MHLATAFLAFLCGGSPAGEARDVILEAREIAMVETLLDIEDWVEDVGGLESIRETIRPLAEAVQQRWNTPIPSRSRVKVGANEYHRFITPGVVLDSWEYELETGDPQEVILDFQEQLAERGIDLIVVPVPGKLELTYADFDLDIPDRYPISPGRLERIMDLLDAGVEVVDIMPMLWEAQVDAPVPLYEVGGHHLSGYGAKLAGELVAQRLERYALAGRSPDRFEVRRRTGTERVDRAIPMKAWQVLDQNGKPYEHVEGAGVIVIGDSHAFAYFTASWASHIARSAGVPISDISESSGGATAHLKFARMGRESVAKRKVVIWIFTSVGLASSRPFEKAVFTEEAVAGPTIDVASIRARIKAYHEAKKVDPDANPGVREVELNKAGYDLIAADELDLALEIFIIATQEWPESANAFDSLGEALALADRKAEAIAALEQVLTLDPDAVLERKTRARLEELGQ